MFVFIAIGIIALFLIASEIEQSRYIFNLYKSKGAMLEYRIAKELGLEIRYFRENEVMKVTDENIKVVEESDCQ